VKKQRREERKKVEQALSGGHSSLGFEESGWEEEGRWEEVEMVKVCDAWR